VDVTDDESWVRAIRQAPDNPAWRLVYADWLEGRCDPRSAAVQLG
jgi:uncharacterized protein (TIGR02996 family)